MAVSERASSLRLSQGIEYSKRAATLSNISRCGHPARRFSDARVVLLLVALIGRRSWARVVVIVRRALRLAKLRLECSDCRGRDVGRGEHERCEQNRLRELR